VSDRLAEINELAEMGKVGISDIYWLIAEVERLNARIEQLQSWVVDE